MGWKRKLAITGVILAGLGFAGYKAYDSGFLEEKLSTAVIPFEYFRIENRKSVKDQQVKDTQRRSIAEYRAELEPFLSAFNGGPSKPQLGEQVDEVAFNELLDPIYGVEYTYVGKASVTGLIQDSDGWSPLITLSVYNDSESIRNITMKLKQSELGLTPEIVRDSTDDFAYQELPSDFNMALVDLATSTDSRFYDNKMWTKATSNFFTDEQLEQLDSAENQVKTRVLFIYSDTQVVISHKYGTTQAVFRIDRSYTLDSLASDKNLLLAPMTITKE